MRYLVTAFALWLLVMTAGVAGQNVKRGREIPSTPTSVKSILYAQRFTLETPYTNTWSKERAKVSTGTLIVVEVDPVFVVPRDTLEPVLYAGNVAVQRLNDGEPSGRVIGIVPGNINLATAPIWFGSPGLPERVTESVVQYERALAEKAGVRAFPSARISSVERTAVTAKDLATLLRDVAANLIYEYSPREKELADSWRLPEAKAVPRRQPN
jgi:hypothetical protein